jgi:hypothetical protein
MKKTLLISFAFLAIAGTLFVQAPSAHSSTGGAPNAATGSPADNRTCASSGCHSGSASPRAGMITANIPVLGYIPGETYTITVSATQAGINKWGFQASPQNSSGTLLGTLVNTDNARTQLTGSGKYITHRSAGNAGSGSNSWSFDWIAPSAGTGEVTFYTAVNASNGNGATSGDVILTDVLTIQEDATASSGSLSASQIFGVYPNPAEGSNLYLKGVNSMDTYQIRDLGGRVLLSGQFETAEASNSIDISRLEKGIYLIQTKDGLARFLRK